MHSVFDAVHAGMRGIKSMVLLVEPTSRMGAYLKEPLIILTYDGWSAVEALIRPDRE